MKPLFQLHIPGHCQPKQSVRGRKSGRYYQTEKVKNYEAYVRGLAVNAWRYCGNQSPAIDEPVELRITIRVERPKSRPAKRFPWPDRMPDFDNLSKGIVDALQGAGVLVNDSRICHSDVWKRYADDKHPIGVDVELMELPT